MEIFLEKGEITPYDEDVKEQLGNCSSKTLERYLQDLKKLYSFAIDIDKEGKKNVWKFIKISDVLERFIANNSYDLNNLFDLAKEFNPEIFKELERGTLKRLATNESVFVFKNYIMEELNSPKTKEIFKDLKLAVTNREYRDIYYEYDGNILYEDVKPLKLVFMNNNWYIAIITKERKFQFLRLSFIQEVKKRYSQGRFQSIEIKQYIDFIANAQNAMSLFGVEKKRALIKANPNIAKYFKDGMKKQLPSQRYIKELEDGAILFSVEYTQELEILPFIQKWLPDLTIVAPQELQNALKRKLKKALESYNGN